MKKLLLLVMILALAVTTYAIGSWIATTPLPSDVQMQGSIVIGDYIYSVSGYSGVSGALTAVYYNTMNPDGSVSATWSTTTDTPVSQCYITDAVSYANGYIYSACGWDYGGGTYVDKVYYAAVNGDGTLGTWSEYAVPSGDEVDCHVSLIYNDYIYIIGGETDPGAGVRDRINYAPINPSDGSIGTWQQDTLYQPLWFMVCEEIDGYLICAGGLTDWANTTAIAEVWSAPINPSDGSIGTWTQQADLPQTIYGPASCVTDGNRMYVLCGRTSGGTVQDTVYYAEVSAGTITSWNTDTSYPDSLRYSNACSNPATDYIYVLGGRSGSSGDVVAEVIYMAGVEPTAARTLWSIYE